MKLLKDKIVIWDDNTIKDQSKEKKGLEICVKCLGLLLGFLRW